MAVFYESKPHCRRSLGLKWDNKRDFIQSAIKIWPNEPQKAYLVNKGALNPENRFFENIPAMTRDTHLPAPAVSFHSIKMKAVQFQTGFHCPESLLQWRSNLQPAWLLIKPYKLKEKEQRTKAWLGWGVHLSVDTFQILAPGNGSWSNGGDNPQGLLLEKQKTLWWAVGHSRTCV